MRLVKIKKTNSTNDYIKKYIKKRKDITVIAEEQTNGRGTKERSFSSNKGGIYLSELKFYQNFCAENAFDLIVHYSMSVVKTLLSFGIEAKIKWPNDILVEGKKICGILTENRIFDGKIEYSLVGLGLNVTNDLPKELSDIAVRVCDFNANATYDQVLLTLLFNLSMRQSFDDYLRYSAVISRNITVMEGENTYSAVVEAIRKDGVLCLVGGKTVAAGEIKITTIN